MAPGIRILKVWFDDDMLELQIDVSDGVSSFANRVYVGHSQFADTVARLDGFSDRLYGGLFDLRFGEFGPEYASGAFHARLHFPEPGRLHITSRQESEYRNFAKKTVASRATLYLRSEPVLLDRFLVELKGVSAGTRDGAWLEAV